MTEAFKDADGIRKIRKNGIIVAWHNGEKWIWVDEALRKIRPA